MASGQGFTRDGLPMFRDGLPLFGSGICGGYTCDWPDALLLTIAGPIATTNDIGSCYTFPGQPDPILPSGTTNQLGPRLETDVATDEGGCVTRNRRYWEKALCDVFIGSYECTHLIAYGFIGTYQLWDAVEWIVPQCDDSIFTRKEAASITINFLDVANPTSPCFDDDQRLSIACGIGSYVSYRVETILPGGVSLQAFLAGGKLLQENFSDFGDGIWQWGTACGDWGYDGLKENGSETSCPDDYPKFAGGWGVGAPYDRPTGTGSAVVGLV